MGLGRGVLAACKKLLLPGRRKRRKKALVCVALQRFWKQSFCRRLAMLLPNSFCNCFKADREEKNAMASFSASSEKDAMENSQKPEKKKEKQEQEEEQLESSFRKRRGGGGSLPRVSSKLQAFNRVSSWSRYVEESMGGELSATVSAVEAEYMVDMSQLFLGQKFASGAYSRLYHGVYKHRAVAVKLIMPPQEDEVLSSRLDKQFSQEVALLSRLRHGNIIEFVAACKKPPVFCVITEYLPGGSVKAFLHKNEPHCLPLKLMTRLALDVARGMEYLHSQGVIHRDLKSDNLIMTDDLQIKVADFGVSCLESHRDSMKGFMGTYRWMAPEMIKEKPCSRKVDVYSFGIVLWELLTGLTPFGEMTAVQVAFAICQEKARPPVPAHCPKELARLMQQCWSSNPVKRPEFHQIVEILQSFNQVLALQD